MLEILRSPRGVFELIESPEYIPLINSFALDFLQKNPSSVGKRIAFEARECDQLVGLMLITVYSTFSRQKALYQSFVVPDRPLSRSCTRQEIAHQLFVYAEEILTNEEKVTTFELSYTKEEAFAPVLENILCARGWPLGKISVLRYFFDAYAFAPPWLHFHYSLPDSLHYFSWKELLPEERREIAHWVAQGRCQSILSPLKDESMIDYETSVGLRSGRGIVGWCITTRPDPETLCYSKLYVDHSMLKKGYGIQLLAESMRRQKQLPIPFALFEVSVCCFDPTWRQFIKKRLLPLATKIEHVKCVERMIP